jgi:hypothetical protein
MPLQAHGLVGVLDEVLYVGIALVFTLFIGLSWWRSRGFEPEMEDSEEESTTTDANE